VIVVGDGDGDVSDNVVVDDDGYYRIKSEQGVNVIGHVAVAVAVHDHVSRQRPRPRPRSPQREKSLALSR